MQGCDGQDLVRPTDIAYLHTKRLADERGVRDPGSADAGDLSAGVHMKGGDVAEPQASRLQADLDSVSEFTDRSVPGWTRTALSPWDRVARVWAQRQLRDLGLATWVDAAGNVLGRWPGTDPTLPALMTGSHLDTVEGGGRFDGVVGFAGGVETVRVLQESDVRLRHDLIVASFFNEEPNRFGLSCIGSRAMTGRLTAEHLRLVDSQGGTFGTALTTCGLDIGNLGSARLTPDQVGLFLELHIEQGPMLEEQESQIGLVTSITGVSRFRALFHGRRGHAGTTPMDRRADAGCAAAGTVLAVEQIGSAHDHSRGTTGFVAFTPEAVNVISDLAEVRGELRSPVGEWLADARSQLEDRAHEEGARRSVEVDLDWLSHEHPVRMGDDVLALLDSVVRGLGYRQSRLYSGAEHDAAVMAGLCPTGMVFVPSRGGLSHCPEEWTDIEAITAGVHVLAQAMVAADRTSSR